jgi:NAD(P)H dehydrogenase (quinone)
MAKLPFDPAGASHRSIVARFALLSFLLSLAGCFDGTASGAADETIIVSGASGQLGSLVVRELLDRGVDPAKLILVSRTPDELEEFASLGASTRFGDFSQPESLSDAYAGGTRMLLISIGTVGPERPELHGNAIDAAVQAGVRHIVYTSFVDAENNPSPIAADHRRTEEMLRASGVAWTMLRNQLYTNGLIGQAARMVATRTVDVPPNAPRTAYVTREDCAAAAATVLATAGHENRVYEITGSELIGPREIANAASTVAGSPIEIVERVPADSPPAPATNTSAQVMTTHVADLTGRPPVTLREFLEANRDALVPEGS